MTLSTDGALDIEGMGSSFWSCKFELANYDHDNQKNPIHIGCNTFHYTFLKVFRAQAAIKIISSVSTDLPQ